MRTGRSMYTFPLPPQFPHSASERQVCRLMLVRNLPRFVSLRFDSVPLYASQQTSRSLFLCLHHFLFLGLSLPLCKITHTMQLIAVTAKKKERNHTDVSSYMNTVTPHSVSFVPLPEVLLWGKRLCPCRYWLKLGFNSF